MKSSWSISILLLLFVSCTSVKPSHLTGIKFNFQDSKIKVTRYVAPGTSHLFKATLDIKKHHLTGLLVIKRIDTIYSGQLTSTPDPSQTGKKDGSGVYRIVFMNEIGMTFFDLEMRPDSFKVVSCFESLSRKALLNIFETDFRMLTWSGSLKNEQQFRQRETDHLVLSGRAGKYKSWFTYSPSGDTLCAIAAKSNIADHVIITFDKYQDGFPLKIILENPFIGMKLSLRKLTQ